MTAAWTTVLALALGTALLKASGPALFSGRQLAPRAAAVIALLPAALLGALVVTDTFVSDTSQHLTLDARAAGLAAAATAVALRRPILVVVLAAAVTTAVVRLLA